jgi:hypothetical protein
MRSKTLRLKKSRKFKKSNRRSRSKRVKRSKRTKRTKRTQREQRGTRSRKRIRRKKRSQRGGSTQAGDLLVNPPPLPTETTPGWPYCENGIWYTYSGEEIPANLAPYLWDSPLGVNWWLPDGTTLLEWGSLGWTHSARKYFNNLEDNLRREREYVPRSRKRDAPDSPRMTATTAAAAAAAVAPAGSASALTAQAAPAPAAAEVVPAVAAPPRPFGRMSPFILSKGRVPADEMLHLTQTAVAAPAPTAEEEAHQRRVKKVQSDDHRQKRKGALDRQQLDLHKPDHLQKRKEALDRHRRR